jgi:hypothetical protein
MRRNPLCPVHAIPAIRVGSSPNGHPPPTRKNVWSSPKIHRENAAAKACAGNLRPWSPETTRKANSGSGPSNNRSPLRFTRSYLWVWRGETAAGGESTPSRSHRARAVNRECDGRHGAAATPAKHTFRPRSSTHSGSSSSSTTTATESFPPPAKPARARRIGSRGVMAPRDPIRHYCCM